ncbi:MAG: RagB/SusD family nutrient uptake outer membrane protein [Paludibacteraceae bacterium]|nr:RagB/SusD family nutrient uptake outer membrane protein [Paludibacteraceae bacterium]
MYKFNSIIIILLLAIIPLTSCDDLLGVDSDRLVSDEEYRMSTSSDSVYAIFGLLTQLQKLADSYVLLGELRADLMDITSHSEPELRQINMLDVNRTNSYANIRDYYAVINNCNYIIQYLDTSVVEKGQKFKLRQYAAVMGIRAWTYMQLALNFGKVRYFEKPLLTLEDANGDFPEYSMEELAPLLIAGLEPVKHNELPLLGYLENYNAAYSLFPVRFVLGDLYLWMGAYHNDQLHYYENAANEYRQLMYDRRVIVDKNNYSHWVALNNTISTNANLYWQRALTLTSGEVITAITCPTEYGQHFMLDTLNNQGRITASQVAVGNWDSQTYYMNEASNTQGDLRKYGSLTYSATTNKEAVTDYTFSGVSSPDFQIYKYKIYKQNVTIYRSTLLYLRYAEAVNRMNKPHLAFAVLKYGLNSTTVFNEKIVPQSERGPGILPIYMSFSDLRFNNNVGIRMRGLGNMDQDTTFFVMKAQATMTDSVLFVEDLIQKELALETAFEGNRFHDLMRLAIRRNNNAYMADIIAPKHGANAGIIHAKLLDRKNWYIK